MNVERVKAIITEYTEYPLFSVVYQGDTLTITLDSHQLSIDEVVKITNELSQLLDTHFPESSYCLDVGTKGMYQPITDYHQYIDTEVDVVLRNGEVVSGTLLAVNEQEMRLSCWCKGQKRQKTFLLEAIEVVKRIEG